MEAQNTPDNNSWQNLLSQGKKYFEQQDWLKAEFYTQQAEHELHEVVSNAPLDGTTFFAWVCANHNLAAIHEHQGDIRVALQYLIEPHKYAMSLFETATEPMHIALTNKTINVTFDRLLSFVERNRICKKCYQALLTAKPINYHGDNHAAAKKYVYH